jgi:hypothetical protein
MTTRSAPAVKVRNGVESTGSVLLVRERTVNNRRAPRLERTSAFGNCVALSKRPGWAQSGPRKRLVPARLGNGRWRRGHELPSFPYPSCLASMDAGGCFILMEVDSGPLTRRHRLLRRLAWTSVRCFPALSSRRCRNRNDKDHHDREHGNRLDEKQREADARDEIRLFARKVDCTLADPRDQDRDC